MNLRHPSLVPSILSPPEDYVSQNPDSSSEKVDVTELEEETVDLKVKDPDPVEKDESKKSLEGVNLSVKGRKAVVTLIRQKEDAGGVNKEVAKCGKGNGIRNSDVWRPY